MEIIKTELKSGRNLVSWDGHERKGFPSLLTSRRTTITSTSSTFPLFFQFLGSLFSLFSILFSRFLLVSSTIGSRGSSSHHLFNMSWSWSWRSGFGSIPTWNWSWSWHSSGSIRGSWSRDWSSSSSWIWSWGISDFLISRKSSPFRDFSLNWRICNLNLILVLIQISLTHFQRSGRFPFLFRSSSFSFSLPRDPFGFQSRLTSLSLVLVSSFCGLVFGSMKNEGKGWQLVKRQKMKGKSIIELTTEL